MTTQPEPADRLNELLDGDGPPVQEPTFSPEMAEQLFAAGALKHLLAADEGYLDRQVGRALANVSLSGQRARWRMPLVWATTAAAVVLIAVVVATQRPEDLMATVDRVIEAAQHRDVDREFEVRVRRREDSSLNDMPPAHVCSRGANKFVAELEFPFLGAISFGADGKEFWVVSPEPMPVWVFTDKEAMERFTERMGLMSQAFQLNNIVPLLRRHYAVALTKDSTEPKELIDFTGQRQASAPEEAPEYIRMVANPKTGRPHKLVLSWGPDQRPLPATLFFKLVSEEPKPKGFYGHRAHHDKDRVVERR